MYYIYEITIIIKNISSWPFFQESRPIAGRRPPVPVIPSLKLARSKLLGVVKNLIVIFQCYSFHNISLYTLHCSTTLQSVLFGLCSLWHRSKCVCAVIWSSTLSKEYKNVRLLSRYPTYYTHRGRCWTTFISLGMHLDLTVHIFSTSDIF